MDDLFRLEQIGRYFGGGVALSPDGNDLAFVVQRPKNTTNIHKQEYLWGNDRADVFVVEGNGSPLNITNGITDGAGYWAPAWSPDGRRLAMLSTKSGNVCLWVWDKVSRRLTQLTDRGVDLYSTLERPYLWVSAKRLFCPMLPTGQKPDLMTTEMRAAQKATIEWPNTWTGKASTMSVLQSGVKPNFDNRPQGALQAIDVETGASQTVEGGFVSNLLLSPNRLAIAYLRKVDIYQPKPNQSLPFGRQEKYVVEAALLNGDALIPQDEVTYDALPGSLRWSADGRSLAFVSRTKATKDLPEVFIFRMADRSVRRVLTEDLDPVPVVYQQPQLEWTSKGDLLLLASRRGKTRVPSGFKRRDWWIVSDAVIPRNATETLRDVPTNLLREVEGSSFVGLADGALWRIRADSAPKNITESFFSRISAIVWPARSAAGDSEVPQSGSTYGRLFVEAQKGKKVDLYLVDLASGQLSLLPKPSVKADLIGYSVEAGTAVFRLSDRSGTHLWISRPPYTAASNVLERNMFLAQIATGGFQRIEYTSMDGKPLGAWLILPPGYQKDKKYPLIVWLYPGSIAGPSPSWADEISFMGALNPQIAAAKGYLVLKPSMPLKLERDVADPMLEIDNGVLPALDKAIALRMADPQRLALVGHSFGGYATYGLITQTNRFKAAAALAGLSDLISIYGGFDARKRYDDFPHEDVSMQALLEIAQIRMGSPPWKDTGRYLRNSPIFYADRVKTPLMIIQGDMDFISMQQGEEFFTALYRQAKRAEFVRYWGEGHVLESPPNIRDMWHRVFAWYDEFLDISRDHKGNLVWNGDKVKSRQGSQLLKPEDFAHFDEMILKETQSNHQSTKKSQ